MTGRRMGRGPRYGLAVVGVVAPFYLAACDGAPPPPDGALDLVQVCASRAPEPVVLDASACRENASGRPTVGEWRSAQLPPSPTGEVEGPVQYDEDGFPYQTVEQVPDTDDGGVFIAAVGQPLYQRGGPTWRGPAPVAALGRTASGVSPRGGTLTRSGRGTAGAGALGSTLRVTGTKVTPQPSPFVSRGGMGLTSTGGAGSKGGTGGASSGS